MAFLATLPLRSAALSSLGFLLSCATAPVDPPRPPPPPPTAEETAAFVDATERCEVEDDCEDLTKIYRWGHLSWRDDEKRLAFALKGCLASSREDLCLDSVIMRNGTGAPGSLAMADELCKKREEKGLLCNERKGLVKDEESASPSVKSACASLRAAPATSPPAALGPLVDRCPGLSTAAQRARARLFRSEASIARAYAEAKTGTPRQMRKFHDRLSPLGDPRAAEIAGLGAARFGKPITAAFTAAKEETFQVNVGGANMELCALDGDAAYLTAVYPRPSAAGVLLRFVLPVIATPLWPFFLFPDARPTAEEKRVLDEAQEQKARETEQRLQKTTGAKRMILVPSCNDVTWFRERAVSASRE